MSLLSTFSDYNKVTDTALQVKYSISPETVKVMGWHKSDISSETETYGEYDMMYYVCSRYATKSYAYVGMTYDAALSCQQAKIDQYTRNYSTIKLVDGTDSEGRETTTISSQTSKYCGSDIACQHSDGCMWNVIINVNETDEKGLTAIPTDLSSVFASENQRQYDETPKHNVRK